MENVQEVCGICGGEWEEIWLDCGLCGDWFHADCVGASMDELGEVNYTCDFCTKWKKTENKHAHHRTLVDMLINIKILYKHAHHKTR